MAEQYKSNYTGQEIDSGIEKANSAVQPEDLGELAGKDTVDYEAEVTNKPTIPSEVTETTVKNWGFTKNTGDYSKPASGIPETDLAEDVQTSLGKADTALQEHQSLDNYYTKGQVDSKFSSVYRYRGTVSTYANLPSGGIVAGDVYNVETDGSNYAWTGSIWDKLGGDIDLSGYQQLIDNSHKLSSDLVDDTNKTHKFVTEQDKQNWNNKGTYSKPSGGIPEEDLSEEVQDKLNSGGGSGTNVEANPTLDGTEAHLDGLKVGSTKYSTRPDLSGKVISIMGDSISTYAGWIPNSDGVNDGTGTLRHAIFYPNYGSYVNNVNMTWWYKLIFNKFKAKLGINESWSGSFVGNNKDSDTATTTTCHAPGNDTGPNTCMASNTRILRLGANGTPDIIYVYGGTNDISQPGTPGESLGTFNSATDYSTVDTTTTKWTYFVDAYRTMIQRMQYYYPKAKIIALLPTYCHSYYNRAKLDEWVEQIKAICDYFGVNYIDLRACGITWANSASSRNAKGIQTLGDSNIHPNGLGHTMIADYVEAETYKILNQDNVKNIVHTVTNTLSTLTNTMSYVTGVTDGESYSATMTGSDLTVCRVSMGGTDITSTAYNNSTGVITIANVTGDIVISEGQAVPTPVTGVSLNAQAKSIMPNDVETLTATIVPANATNKNVTWSVNNNNVTIVPNGLTCQVTGVSNGTSVVTVTTQDGSFTASCTFTIHEIELESIAITTPPSTTAYHYGDTFSKTGMVVTAYYDDETSEVLDDSDYTVSPSGALTDSDTSITISYTYNGVTKTATQNITVATLSSIAVTTQPTKTTYYVGEIFDPSGMIVTATWSDNTTSTVTNYTYTPDTALTSSDTTITISYTVGGITQTATQAITVNTSTIYYHTENATSAVINAEAKPSYASFINYSDKTYFEGKTILSVRLKPYTAGTLTVGLVQVSRWSNADSKSNATQITLQQSDVGQVTEYPLSIYCPSGYAPYVMETTDTGTFYYKEGGQGSNGFNNQVARGKTVGLSNACNLGVDFGIASAPEE